MDQILDELGGKWGSLTKDVQIATAQTVAGVRQYNQLIALMDNWDKFQNNVTIAENSEGELEKQAEIYAESWDAASARVQAAAEDIYTALLNDEFFIDLTNIFADVLEGVKSVIDGLGGMEGILLLIGSLFMKNFAKEIPTAIRNMASNFSILTGAAQKTALEQKRLNQAMLEAEDLSGGDRVYAAKISGMAALNKITLELSENEKYLSQEEKAAYQARIQNIQGISENIEAHAREVQALEKSIEKEKELAAQKVVDKNVKGKDISQGDYNKKVEDVKKYVNALEILYKKHTTLQQLMTQMDKKGKQFEKFAKDADKSSKSVETLKKHMSEYVDELKQSGQLPKKAFQEIDKLLKDDTASMDQLTQGYDKFVQSVNAGHIEDKMRELSGHIENVEKKLKAKGMDSSIIRQLEKQFEEGAISAQEFEAELQRLSEQADGAGTKIASIPEKLGNFASACMSVGMALSAIKNLGSIWSDEDASAGEKLIATMTALSSILPVITVMEQAYTAILGKEKAEKAASNLLTKLGIVAKTGEAAATSGATAAQWSLNAAMAANPIGAVIALVVALVAVLGGLAYIIYKVATAQSESEKAAERAEQGAANLAEKYGEAKQAWEDLVQAMDDYQSARDALNSLTKGTEEYKQALKEANRQALELINQYGLIEGQDFNWEGDQLVINDEAMNRLKSEKQAELDTAYAASQMANVKAKEARNVVNQDKLREQIKDDNGYGEGDRAWRNVGSYLAASLLPGIGTVVGAEQIAQTEIQNQAYNNAIDKAVEMAKTNANLFDTKEAMADALGIEDSGIIDALWENKDSIKQLSADMNAAEQAWKVAAQNSANEIMSESGYENTEAGQMALEAGGEIYDQLYSSAYDDYLEKAKSRGAFNTGNADSKAAFNAYAKEAGLDQLKNFKVTNYKGDGTVEYKYIDEEGNEQTKLATAEEIAATLAAADAADQLKESMSHLKETITDLNNGTDDEKALADFISTGNFEGSTKGELDTLKEEIGDVTSDADIEAYLDKKFGDGKDGKISDATAQKYGYANADEMVAKMKASLEVDFEIPEGMDEKIANQLTLGASQKISATYEKLGEEGGEAFVNALNSINTEDLKPEEITKMTDELANVDWTAWDAGEQAAAIVEKYGASIEDADGKWQEYINTMRDASNAVPDLKALATTMREVQKIASDMDVGSIISQEDYETLVKFNSALEDYFTILSDGSAQFIGDKLDFQQQVEDESRKQLEEGIDAYMDRLDEINKQREAGANAVGGEDKIDDYRDSENFVKDGKNYYYGSNVNTQLDFLESQGYNQDQLEKWRLDLEDGSTTVQVLDEIAAAVDSTADAYNELGTEAEVMTGLIQTSMNEIALQADDAKERVEMLKDGTVNAAAYGQAAMAAINEEKWEGLDAKEVEDYSKYLQEAAESSELLSDELKNNEEAAEDVALYTKKMNKGIDKLADGFDDWSDVLKKSDKASEEYAAAMTDMKDAMSDVLGTSEEFISNDFIIENLEDIEKAATGDAEAIDRLKIALSEDIICQILAVDNFEDVNSDIQDLHNQILGFDANIQVGATLDSEEFATAAQDLIDSAGMTVEQAQAYFNSLGYEPEFVMTNEKRTAPMYGKRVYTDDVVMGEADDGTPYVKEMTTHEEQVYMGEQEQNFIVPALSADGTPEIKSVTKVSTGKMNNYSSSNSGGKKPGGGGGKSSDPKKLDKKKAEDPELDRYHVITEQLERLNDELEKISKAKDRAFGSKKLKLMDQEIAKTNEIIQKNKEYADLLKKNRDDAKNKLAGLGAQFDENGVITNYNDLIKNNQADYSEYNKKVDEYNGMSAKAQEELDKQYQAMKDADGNYYGGYQDYLEKMYAETAEARQEEFEKLLEQYESDQEEYEKIMQQIQDDIDANFDREMAKIDYVVEIKLDVDDRDIKHLEFLLEMIEDKDFNAAEAIANIGQQVDETLSKIDTYKQGINDILGKVGKGYTADDLLNGNVTLDQLAEEGLTEEGLAQLEGYIDGLAEENSALRAMRENAWAQVSDEFNEYIEKMDSGIEKIEHLKSITESYKNIVDIVGKKFLGVSNELLDKMNEATVKQSTDLLEANKAKMEAVQSAYDALLNTDTSGWSEQAKKQREEQLKEMEAELQGAKEAFMSSWEEALQASADRYAAAVDNIISEFEDTIAGLYGSLDELQEAFNRAQDLNSQYVEDYEQIYQLTKLTRDINKYIDDTDNLEAKAAYRDYLQQINEELENGKQLSEYDIEYRQKKLELIAAEMALKEAKTAKSSVSMVRGEDGNYSYMYTASDEDVSEAEQNYEDKLFEMQQLNGDYINNLQDQIIQTQAECAQALAAIKESDFNSYEEWREAVDRTQEFYNQKLNFYYSQLDGTLSNNRNLYENDWTRYSEATGYKISADEDFVDRFNETSYSLVTGFQTREQAQNEWNIASDRMLIELSTAYSTWQSEVDTIMGAAGTSVEGFADKMEEETDRNVQDSEKAKDAVEDMAEKMQEDFANTIDKIVEWESTWGAKVDDAIKKNNELIASYNALKQAMADALDTGDDSGNGDGSGDGDNGGGDGSGGGGDSGGGGSAPDNSDKAAGVAAAIWMDGGPESGWGNNPTRSQRLNEKGVAAAQAYIDAHGPNGDIYKEWSKKRSQLKNFYYGSFDTGGYTGDWGDKSGRLALLHSKEIVLNAEDTKNFLSAIELVREIANIIDLNAAAASGAFGSLSSATSVHGAESEIVQQIEIHAEFPDANNHSEIELAFNNLLNSASQYANRSR